MSEKLKGDMYSLGQEFYDRAIETAKEKLTSAKTAYESIVATEELELAELKLTQLTRRKEILVDHTIT